MAPSTPTVTEIGQHGRADVAGVAADQYNSAAGGRDPRPLVGFGQRGIQRNDDQSRARGRQQSDDELGAARCSQTYPVAGHQAAVGQLPGHLVDQSG